MPQPTPLEDRIEAIVARNWRLAEASLTPHHAGMNSATWLVDQGSRRWVAKAVPLDEQPGFPGGLAVAAIVDTAGIPSGAPLPTPDGRLAIAVDGWFVGLLTWVEGTPLTGSDAHQQHVLGPTLAAVHRALLGRSVPESTAFRPIDPSAPHLDLEPWLRPAVADALAATEDIAPSLRHGLLHTDPAPEAFRVVPDGRFGLIDWDRAVVGPLLYDVASAVMYLGGEQRATAFLDAYLDAGPLDRDELDRGLPTLRRFRWAVQADYFARRIATHDLTGRRSIHRCADAGSSCARGRRGCRPSASFSARRRSARRFATARS